APARARHPPRRSRADLRPARPAAGALGRARSRRPASLPPRLARLPDPLADGRTHRGPGRARLRRGVEPHAGHGRARRLRAGERRRARPGGARGGLAVLRARRRGRLLGDAPGPAAPRDGRAGTRGMGAAARVARARGARRPVALGARARAASHRARAGTPAAAAGGGQGELHRLPARRPRRRVAVRSRGMRRASNRTHPRGAGGMSVAAATARPAARVAPSRARPQLGLELAAFFSLAAFVAVRYAALIATPPTLRVVLVAAYATLGCGLLAATGRLTAPRPAVTVLRLAIVLGTFAISMLALRVPAHLLAPGQWNHLAHRLSGGVDEISGWLWPYRGGDRWAQAAVLLPIPAILLAAGCTSFWPSPAMLATRRVLAVAALLAVFVAGTANAPSPLPTLDGVVLAALVAATLLLPFASGSETGRALCWLAVCCAAALTAQSALSSSNPWIHYRDAAASPLSATFQWHQMCGPDRWPRSQASMLAVSEPNPTLLRVTSLDRFDGLRFLRSPDPPGSLSADFPRANLQRWTDRASIEVRGLRSSMLASGGGLPESVRWLNDIAPPLAWQPDRTAESTAVPARGNAYVVSFYEPRPSPKEAAAAPRTYPRAYLPYVLFALPSTGATALGTASVQPDIRLGGPSAEVVGPS